MFHCLPDFVCAHVSVPPHKCVCNCMSVSVRGVRCVCDSSSEIGDEWASSLGTAGAIFSSPTGLYNGTAGEGVCKRGKGGGAGLSHVTKDRLKERNTLRGLNR